MTGERLNPHNWIEALDPPRSHPPRRWRCHYCGAEDLLDDLQKRACSYVYPPCASCGQTPECARDCKGVWDALGAPGVVVTGIVPKGSA